MHNVLAEPLITLCIEGRREGHTLPSVLALLSGGVQVEFERLQPHQQHPWYAFLVQLAALAMEQVTTVELMQTATAWQDALLKLTQGSEAPWCLVVEDLSSPALLQPPIPEGTLQGFKPVLHTPGEIDVLITAKNFDVKIRRMGEPDPEHWLFALVSKQTSEGVLGQGNYGIARMNGGISSRPCVSLVPSLEWGPRFVRDVGLWQAHRKRIQKEHGYSPQGIGLVWLVPWDGVQKLARRDLHPFFIEICRRIRLVKEGESIGARVTNTKGTRIHNEGHGGHTGDLWTPIYFKKGVPTSLSLDERGFHFRRVQELLLQWQPHPAMTPVGGDGWLVAASLCRAQGKTLGYHERVVALPAKIDLLLAQPKRKKQLADIAAARVDRFSEVLHGLLKPSLLALLQGILDGRVDLRDVRAQVWLERFEQRVDEVFFPHLWETAELEMEASLRAWDVKLLELVQPVVDTACMEIPLSSAQRGSLLVGMRSRFNAGKAKMFPHVGA